MHNKIKSVNFHLWQPCNFRCKFCFDTFQDVKSTLLPKGHLSKEKAFELINAISQAGFKRISFCGGEPTLCPWLPELIAYSKSLRLYTNLITNGYRLIEDNYSLLNKIENQIDCITLSIDSLNPETNNKIGRSLIGKYPLTEMQYRELILGIKSRNILLRINTVVCKYNYQENFSEFVADIMPSRWKIMKAISMQGQNDEFVDEFSLADEEFKNFVSNNEGIHDSIEIAVRSNVTENKNYYLIDPAGRFFDDALGKHIYTNSILEVGILQAVKEIELIYQNSG